MELHADFADLDVVPGTMELRDGTEAGTPFGITNLIAFGGDAARPTHVPETVGEVGDAVLWESTGASDALPFWNTNFDSDVYLYLVHGEVRVEFKTPESDHRLGSYQGRTGDLMKLPKAIAHRTFSTSTRRRISLEILRRNPAWERIGEHRDVPAAATLELDGLAFKIDGDEVVISSSTDAVRTPAGFLARGFGALVAYELHLGHNEFEGGFVVEDRGEDIRLRTPGGHDRGYEPAAVLAVFKGLIRRLRAGSD